MKIWRSESEFDGSAASVALGMFDGVHIGHQALIYRAKDLAREMNARCVVCTFDRHPLSVIRPEQAPEQLLTIDQKLEKLENERNSLLSRIQNPKFMNNAKPELIKQTQNRIEEINTQSKIIKDLIESLAK